MRMQSQNVLCISIVIVLNKKNLLKNITYFYLSACHVIINQHQRNCEHANVIIIEIFILKSQENYEILL